MRVLAVRIAIALWLFVSAWVLPHSETTAWNSIIVALAVIALAFFAFGAIGSPGLRYFITVMAMWLFMSAMVLPHESLWAVMNDVAVAVALALVSIIPPKRWGGKGAEPPAVPA
jgi:uncharacterized membrane protein YccC